MQQISRAHTAGKPEAKVLCEIHLSVWSSETQKVAVSSGGSSRKAGQPQGFNEDRRKLLLKVGSAEALCSLDRLPLELGLKAESCGSDQPLASAGPGKMGCSHLPHGTRQLLNSSIISQQQLGTGRKAALSRGKQQPAMRPRARVQKARENRGASSDTASLSQL